MKDDTTDQPFIDHWPMFEEACSKLPAPVDINAARVRLARRFNKSLPKHVETELAWQRHKRGSQRRSKPQRPTWKS